MRLWRFLTFIADLRYNIWYGLGNLIVWLPVIWQDRDWDEHFLYRVMYRKLTRMEKLFRLHGNSINAKKDAKKIKTCALLLKRLIDHEYTEKLNLIYHQEGFDNFIKALNAGERTITCPTIGWLGNRWMKYEDYMVKQDLDLLFRLFEKHIQTWWD